MVSTDVIRKYCLSLPQSKEIEHWGKPSFRVNNKIFAVIQEDGVTLTIKTVGDDRSIYTSMDPEAYKIPDSFANLNYMLVNLNIVDWTEMSGLLEKAWTSVAPKKLVKEFLAGGKEKG